MRGQSLTQEELEERLRFDVQNLCIEMGATGRKLTKLGEELCASLLQLATPTPRLQWPILKTIWDRRLIRMNPMELWFIDESVFGTDGTPRVLLSQRPANDPYFPRQWHNPGNYVGGGKVGGENVVSAETVAEACRRCALKETGAPLKNCALFGVGDFVNLSRDPELSLIFLCTLGDTPKLSDTLRWFPVNELPENMMEHSRAMLEQRVVPYMQLVMIDAFNMHPDARDALMRMGALMQPLQLPAK